MVQATMCRDTVLGQASPADLMVETFRFMLLARVLDEKMASLYRTGKIHGGVFLGRGQEALSAVGGSCPCGRADVFAPASPRHGWASGLWGTGLGLCAHLSGLGAGTHARTRRQCSSRPAGGRDSPHDQPPRRDDLSRQRHSLRQARQWRSRCSRRHLSWGWRACRRVRFTRA